jgi:hypothetical protein
MEQERNFVRLQKGGTHMLIEAAQMGKAAAPKIMLIFNEANESDYSFARNSAPAAPASEEPDYDSDN